MIWERGSQPSHGFACRSPRGTCRGSRTGRLRGLVMRSLVYFETTRTWDYNRTMAIRSGGCSTRLRAWTRGRGGRLSGVGARGGVRGKPRQSTAADAVTTRALLGVGRGRIRGGGRRVGRGKMSLRIGTQLAQASKRPRTGIGRNVKGAGNRGGGGH